MISKIYSLHFVHRLLVSLLFNNSRLDQSHQGELYTYFVLSADCNLSPRDLMSFLWHPMLLSLTVLLSWGHCKSIIYSFSIQIESLFKLNLSNFGLTAIDALRYLQFADCVRRARYAPNWRDLRNAERRVDETFFGPSSYGTRAGAERPRLLSGESTAGGLHNL